MKAFLLYPDRDFDLHQQLPPQARTLVQDLELSTLFHAMARGDKLLFEVAQQAVLSSVNDLATITYRQHILQDCLRHPEVVRAMYQLAGEAIAGEKTAYYGFFSKYPEAILGRGIEVLHLFVTMLRQLKAIADERASSFTSEGLTTLFAMLQRELSEEYFARIQEHLRDLKFPHGVLISAQLGRGNKGINYVLRQPPLRRQNWLERLFAEKPPSYTLTISDRDERGARALGAFRERGINLVANALAQSADHILSFFVMLRTELAFYLGCLNLSELLAQKGMPFSFPVAVAASERQHTFRGLYDICLALTATRPVVGNDVQAEGKALVMITGANQGGKSTFLRSIGLAQLMMQCGMFVSAAGYLVQMISVPLLALAGNWLVAVLLIILERVGKATRNPPRDVMLSHAGQQIGGYGWAFGLHEALDQSGALVGPLVAAGILAWRGEYHLAFALLAIPAFVTLSILLAARLSYPHPEELEAKAPNVQTSGLPRVFWIYLAGAVLVGAGFADFPLIAYHFARIHLMAQSLIPVFYAVAMGISGIGSLLFGRLFDRMGLVVLVPLTLLSALFAPLVFLGGFWLALLGMALWGLGMGVHESIIPAAVTLMVPAGRRASAYGLFTAGYGIFWFLGSALIGILYGVSLPILIGFSLMVELAAIPIFWLTRQKMRQVRDE